MTLDKVDLCEARAAFDAHAVCKCEECWRAGVRTLEVGLHSDASPQLAAVHRIVRDAVLAAREWHRALAEKAKERAEMIV